MSKIIILEENDPLFNSIMTLTVESGADHHGTCKDCIHQFDRGKGLYCDLTGLKVGDNQYCYLHESG